MTRPVEIRLMRRSEINWPKATWQIPAERMKMRRPHDVHLSKQSLAVLRESGTCPMMTGSCCPRFDPP
jgi:integrase